jgi:L-lactate dehydrogenase complex protein LldG
MASVDELILQHYPSDARIISMLAGSSFEKLLAADAPRQFENVDVMIVQAHLGVSENGAVWITEEAMGDRVLPFICEHLVVLLHQDKIVPTLQEAYIQIGQADYEYGTFIAGPSKTADIEQSLVLGAHGPKTMTVLLLPS